MTSAAPDVTVVLPARDEAAKLPNLIAPFLAAGADPQPGLVQGQRLRRQDPWSKRIGSRLANGIRNALLGDGVRDSGCGMKAFSRASI